MCILIRNAYVLYISYIFYNFAHIILFQITKWSKYNDCKLELLSKCSSLNFLKGIICVLVLSFSFYPFCTHSSVGGRGLCESVSLFHTWPTVDRDPLLLGGIHTLRWQAYVRLCGYASGVKNLINVVHIWIPLTLPNLIYTMGTNDLILNFKNTFVFKRLNTGNIQKPLAHREEQA